MKIEDTVEISALFSLFHDGAITHYRLDQDCLSIDIEIEYLAKKIRSGFSKFKVRLFQFDHLSFLPWNQVLNDNYPDTEGLINHPPYLNPSLRF